MPIVPVRTGRREAPAAVPTSKVTRSLDVQGNASCGLTNRVGHCLSAEAPSGGEPDPIRSEMVEAFWQLDDSERHFIERVADHLDSSWADETPDREQRWERIQRSLDPLVLKAIDVRNRHPERWPTVQGVFRAAWELCTPA